MTAPTVQSERREAHAPPDTRPVLHAIRPRCPRCGSARLRAYKSIDVGGDTIVRYVACRGCGGKALLILE